MPNQRAEGQIFIGLMMQDTFLMEVDRAAKTSGSSNRSEFIRDAIREKMARLGIRIEMREASPPYRAGKSLPARKPNSAEVERAISTLSAAEAAADRLSPSSSPKREAPAPSAHKPPPSRGAAKASKGKQSPPSQAPK